MSEAPRLRIVRGEDAPEPPPRDPQDPGFDPDAGSKGSAKAEPDERPVVVVKGGQQHILLDRALSLLPAAKEVYVRGNTLCRVVPPMGEEAACLLPIHKSEVRVILSRLGHWVADRRRGDRVVTCDVDPPVPIVEAVSNRGFWPGLRVISLISCVPPVRPDGSVQWEEGFDSCSGTYYVKNAEVPKQTLWTQDSAVACRKKLLDVVADFPWASDIDQDVWLAGLLAPFVRAWCGPAPAVLITSSAAGSGKSLLADVIGRVIIGRDLSRMTWTRNQQDARKELLALAVRGEAVVLMDNLPNGSTIEGAVFDNALTASRVFGRVLGVTHMVDVSLKSCWYLTGNNISPSSDSSRRVLICNLASKCERPDERIDMREKRLRQYVMKWRSDMIVWAITIIAGYLKSTSPRPNPLGSFEGWSDSVRGAVIWAGGADVVDALGSRIAGADLEAELHVRLLRVWGDLFTRGATASTALARAGEADLNEGLAEVLAELCPGRDGRATSVKYLTKKLRGMKNKVRTVDGRLVRIERKGTGAGGAPVWIVTEVKEEKAL